MNRGIALGVGAYTLWGLLPVFWKAIDTVDSLEILAHRIVWSVFFLAGVITIRRSWDQVRRLTFRVVGRLLLAGTLLALNWATYIWAVNNGHIVESSLGYFINPLLSVVLGVVVLRERLETAQWVAVGVAAAGIESLTVEVALVLLPALAFLGVIGLGGEGAFGSAGPRVTVLLILTGVATALPLVLFGAAAHRIKLSTIGLLQYIAPSFQFLIGVFLYSEVVGRDRLIGFVLVWIALAMYTGHGLASRRRGEPQPLAV
jgi:chloramphenicol-sensitive protein RarD